MSKVFQLAYISFVSEGVNPNKDLIDEILKVANSNNRDKGITGFLVYRSGAFLQLLEGEKEQVLDLYGRIATDLRHEGCKILVKQNANERIFPSWAMFYKKDLSDKWDELNPNLKWGSIIEMTKNRRNISPDVIKETLQNFAFSLNMAAA